MSLLVKPTSERDISEKSEKCEILASSKMTPSLKSPLILEDFQVCFPEIERPEGIVSDNNY